MKTSTINIHTKFRLNVVLLLLCLYLNKGCQIIPDQLPIEKDGILCGITDGNFQNEWWDYYERGLSFSKCGCWNEAASDLQKAINIRGTDKWDARTYSMYYIDYFPHRELGIVRYYQGYTKIAINELTTSLGMVKSAKAEKYLDRARKNYIEKTQKDLKPPEITINSISNTKKLKSPFKHYVTNDLSVRIHGIVKDNTFVRYIKINKKKLNINISEKAIPFNKTLPIKSGENIIPVSAIDLVGNESQVTYINIYGDHLGPVISVDEHDEVKNNMQTIFSLKATIFDVSGIKEIILNNEKIICDNKMKFYLEKDITIQSNIQSIKLVAIDYVGNNTIASIFCRSSKKNVKNSSYLLANNDISFGNVILSKLIKRKNYNYISQVSNSQNSYYDIIAPKIEITQPQKYKEVIITYLDRAYISGFVEDNTKLKEIIIEEKEIEEKKISKCSGKRCYFKTMISLKEDKNYIFIQCRDIYGNTGTAEIVFKRLTPKIYNKSMRYRLAIKSFEGITALGPPSKKALILEKYLLNEMRQTVEINNLNIQRFSICKKLITESKTENDALQRGKQLGVDCVLIGDIIESFYKSDKNEIETLNIVAKIIDVDGNLLSLVDIYNETAPNDNILRTLKMLAKELYLTIIDELPLLHGSVTEVNSNKFTINIGNEYKMKKNMQIVVYEHEYEDQVKDSNILEIKDSNILGYARIVSVNEKFSDANTTEIYAPITPTHMIITR